MADEKAELQVDGAQEKPEEAGEVTQPAQPAEEAPVAEKPGEEALVTPTPTPPTFTAEQVGQREAQLTSKLQAETARLQRQLAESAMQQEIEGLVREEQRLQVKDQQDVADGRLSEAEAEQRKGQRVEAVRARFHGAALAQRQAQLDAQGELQGRVLMAQDLGRKYGVDPDVLIRDTTITNQTQMLQKAFDLHIAVKDAQLRAARLHPETFDRGPSGEPVRGSNADRVIKGYGEGDAGISRADYEKAMRTKGLL